MTVRRIAFLTARLYFCALFVFSSVYSLLAYLPFTFHELIQGKLLAWLPAFIALTPMLYWGAVAAVALTLVPELRARSKPAMAFVAALAAGGAVLLVHPVLSGLTNDASSLAWAFVWCLPLVGLAAIDFAHCRLKLAWDAEIDGGENQRLFVTCAAAAIFVALMHFVVAVLRHPDAALADRLVALARTIASHLVLFMGGYAILNFTRAVAGAWGARLRSELPLWNFLGIVMLALLVRGVVLDGLAFNGPSALAYAIVLAASMVVYTSACGIRLLAENGQDVGTALALALIPLTFGKLGHRFTRALWLAAIGYVTFLVADKTAVFDWNFLFQRLFAAFTWLFAFAVLYEAAPREAKRADWSFALLMGALVTLAGYRALVKTEPYFAELFGDEKLDAGAIVDRYVTEDLSFRLVSEILAPTRAIAAEGDPYFYKYLQQNSNIPRETPTPPVDVNLVDKIIPVAGPKPNIVMIVVDSLRRDYVGAYNPKVEFTPSMKDFGAENIVMQNSFTRYGATGLAEPSIWVGGMILHKQYVIPFYPMNSLQKLMEAEGYAEYISMDSILDVIVKKNSSFQELDPGLSTQEIDLCGSLPKLVAKIEGRPKEGKPFFAYTQPQNVHVSVINREGASVPPGESYPGFYAPYASRLKRIDECFGKFIAKLKEDGIYDNTVVILTADHGDSLGEDGRFGHAYTIFPEIMRIPLLIHLPERLKTSVVWDAKEIVFSTDITPSLYFLLGHKPVRPAPFFGKSIFAANRTELLPYPDERFLVASSYGAVYGLLSKDAKKLYIADGVNFRDYYYEMGDADRSVSVAPEKKLESEKLIREGVSSIDKFYHFP